MIQPVTITITLDPNGSVSVNGPLNQKVLCYGILEAGKEAIAAFGRDQGGGGGPRILPAGGPLIPIIRSD